MKLDTRKLKYQTLGAIIKALILLSNILPRRTWLVLCGAGARLVAAVAPKLLRKVISNLELAFSAEKTPKEIRVLARDVFTMLGRNAGLVIKSFKMTREDFYRHCSTRGDHYAEEAFKSGRGVIFLTAHIGPFESIAHDLSLKGYQPYIIGTVVKDPALNDLLIESRTKFGAVAIERGKETLRIMKNLRAGGTMAILIDQDTRVKSVFVDFFGKPCSTPVGAAMLALKTGAAVIPVFAHLNDAGTAEIEYFPEVEMTRSGNEENDLVINTQTMTAVIENQIRKFPSQWVWMHDRWKTAREMLPLIPSV